MKKWFWMAALVLAASLVEQKMASAQLIISEFRVRGPNGANDEFIEIHNNSGAAHTVAGGGTGYAVAASNGVARFVIPNGTVIPRNGHYLGVNSVGYSLASYPAGNGTNATGNSTYTSDIPDNAGIAIFNTSVAANFSLANRMDAVGSTSEANTIYKEGSGYSALTPFSIDYSFVRQVPGGCTGSGGGNSGDCVGAGQITGTSGPGSSDSVDSNNNALDFIFVDTNGTSAGAGQRLGAPGPQNLSSPITGANGLTISALDTSVSGFSAPNVVRDTASDPANNSTFGTLDVRVRVTNTSGANVTRLRFRVLDLTTFPSIAGVSDLRPRTSMPVVVTSNDAGTCAPLPAPCAVPVQGTTLEQPPSQPNGGGFNSSLSAGTVTLATPVANGASVNVRFLLGIQQTGDYRFGIVAETLPNAGSAVFFLKSNTQNNAPTAANINKAPSEDVAFNFALADFTNAFSDPDASDPLENITITSLPNNGTLRLGATAVVVNQVIDDSALATLNYTSNLNFNGADAFNFSASDGDALSNVATVNLAVGAVNDAPVATPQTLNTNEETPLNLTLAGTDVEGDALTFAIVANPTNGVLSGSGAARTYTPNLNFSGADSFSFTANDGTATSTAATVSIAVAGVNDAPSASAQNLSTNEDTPLSITLAGNDADGDALTFTVVTQPTSGVLSGSGAARTYTPNLDFNGSDSFSFTVNDGTVTSAPATITLQVLASNDVPVAGAQTLSTSEDTPLSIALGGTDAEGSALVFAIVSGPVNGVLSGSGATRTYTPNANFNGVDSFTFTANDGTATSTAATVAIAVGAVNDVPTAIAQTLSTSEDTPLPITLAGTDIEGSALTFTVVNQPTNGVLSGDNANRIYTPNLNFSGTDSFTFTAGDGVATSTSVTVSLTITATNDAPVAVNDLYPSSFRVLKVIAAEGVLVNDGDAETPIANLIARVVTSPTKGTLSFSADGSFTYTPFPSVQGPDSFTYVLSDGTNDSNVATVNLGSSPAFDRAAPIISIGTPRQGSTLRDFNNGVSGFVSDPAGDRSTGAVAPSGINRVQVLLVRLSDNFTWNGSAFVSTPTPLTATLTALPGRPNARSWRLNVPLPTSSNLTTGLYQIAATATDNAGNRSRTNSIVRVLIGTSGS